MRETGTLELIFLVTHLSINTISVLLTLRLMPAALFSHKNITNCCSSLYRNGSQLVGCYPLGVV